MIALAIVATLAAVAYPSYTRAVVRSHRVEAQNYLREVAQQQEEYLFARRRYADTLLTLNKPVPEQVAKYYTVEMVTRAAPPPGFSITATPKTGTVQADDPALVLDNTGLRTPADLW